MKRICVVWWSVGHSVIDRDVDTDFASTKDVVQEGHSWLYEKFVDDDCDAFAATSNRDR